MKHLPRSVLAAFVQAMEERLLANDHKGGWHRMSYEELLLRALEELSELSVALRTKQPPNALLREAADVANFVMMIADNEAAEALRNLT